ncbi:MAG: bis-aminopropyl spermidine synthase family protein [candidate division WWE3 bacterium]|nr:bis-aminopropyl spermidine synthase family protein [candidate division WWE3 bacterium]
MERPKAKRNFDQFLATSSTVSKRVELLKNHGDLTGSRILLLGDDDLLSIALARTKLPAEVTVLDIDNDILSYIQDISQKENLKIKVQKYDARVSMPVSYKNYFDVAFSDPPYTPSGFGTFLRRLVFATTKDANLYICYGYTLKELEKPLKIQKLLTDWGLLIREKMADFNEYSGAKSIGSHSSIYLLKKTPQTHVDEKMLGGKFYTNN